MKKQVSPLNIITLYRHIRGMFLYHDHGFGLLALCAVIITLSILCGLPFGQNQTVFVAGDIATQLVVSDRDIIVEDSNRTKLRREQLRTMQPIIFDINKKNITRVRDNILLLLQTLNTVDQHSNTLEKIRNAYNEKHSTTISLNTLKILTQKESQQYIINTLLPWVETQLNAGIVPDMRLLPTNSIIIRNLGNNLETLVSAKNGLMDLPTLIVTVGNRIRMEKSLPDTHKNAIISTIPYMLLATLSINQEATKKRTSEVLSAIDPVLYKIHKGEVLVRKGDLVTPALQLKMQSIFQESRNTFNITTTLGTMFLGLTLMLGLFMSPSGNQGRILRNKDQLFIALLLLLVGLCATFFAHFSFGLTNSYSAALMHYAFPIAGIAGLAVLIFSARRYCVIGLLLSFFTASLFKGGIEIFIFYFLSAMANTWFILRSQNRHDVILGSIPLFFCQIILGFSAAFIHNVPFEYYTALAIMLGLSSIFSLLALFALSPVLEILFGYTTRFRLMELMSLDHPLLQDLMMTIPGTYHHSLVVSNLAESGAKAIGANSLLVKVGALYHDIGKLARPEYFSENQFNNINPHDKLSPTMSCLILFSHVKHGAELAAKHNLGCEITDMIIQHHGTRLPLAFYHKAEKLGEHPDEIDYRYPGPRPQSSEAAILMMADTVEAAIRSMGDPSPARISTSVETLIKNIYAEGQLDETDMKFKDLHKLIESFTRSLTGLFHQRISYPEFKKNEQIQENTFNLNTNSEPPTC